MKFKDLAGKKFGRLTALKPTNKGGRYYWRCLCLCGSKITVNGADLNDGHTKSCGCYKIDLLRIAKRTHGESVNSRISSEYRTWVKMKSRCYNRCDKSYQHYGGRGISVCELWRKSFSRFLKDMGRRPNGLSLDRINNDGNYEPSNCRWATKSQQANNNRHNRILNYEGKALTISQWSNLLGINAQTIYQRIHRGWSHERALCEL